MGDHHQIITYLLGDALAVVLQCKLVSGWGLRKQRSAPPYEAYGLGRTLRLCCVVNVVVLCCYSHEFLSQLWNVWNHLTIIYSLLQPFHRLTDWLVEVQRPTRHGLGHFGDNVFTGQMTQPTVSKHWRRVGSYPDYSPGLSHHVTIIQHACTYKTMALP